ncbi:MAG TPA: O-antigen ligase family protein, partial [Aggregatilineales bacterium]|nr:O-antigen ligase family protein [Aggregatilineales bacterium]
FVGGPGVIAADGTTRIASVYGSPNNLALFLGRCLPFALAAILVSRSTARRVLVGIGGLIMLTALFLTQSAGALLFGLPAAFVVVLILWDRRKGLIATAGAAAAGLALIPLSRFVPRLQNILGGTRASTLARTYVWQSAISLLKERPLTGAGLDQFLYLYRSRYILPEGWREPDLSHPHNIILDYWVRLGIAGLAVLALSQIAFWQAALGAWRRWRTSDLLLTAIVIGAMGSMADFLAHGLIDNSFFVIDLAYVFCFTLALVVKIRDYEEGTTGLKPSVPR